MFRKIFNKGQKEDRDSAAVAAPAEAAALGLPQRTMQIFVRFINLDHRSITLDVAPSDTIEIVKQKIHAKIPLLSPERQRLCFPHSRVLNNAHTLSDCNIQKESTISVKVVTFESDMPPPPVWLTSLLEAFQADDAEAAVAALNVPEVQVAPGRWLGPGCGTVTSRLASQDFAYAFTSSQLSHYSKQNPPLFGGTGLATALDLAVECGAGRCIAVLHEMGAPTRCGDRAVEWIQLLKAIDTPVQLFARLDTAGQATQSVEGALEVSSEPTGGTWRGGHFRFNGRGALLFQEYSANVTGAAGAEGCWAVQSCTNINRTGVSAIGKRKFRFDLLLLCVPATRAAFSAVREQTLRVNAPSVAEKQAWLSALSAGQGVWSAIDIALRTGAQLPRSTSAVQEAALQSLRQELCKNLVVHLDDVSHISTQVGEESVALNDVTALREGSRVIVNTKPFISQRQRQRQRAAAAGAGAGAGVWACEQCTFENAQAARQCEMCGDAHPCTPCTAGSDGDEVRRLKQQLEEAEAGRALAEEGVQRFKQATQQQADDATCVICMERPTESVFGPCGHKCCCHACAQKTLGAGSSCPICRTAIQQAIRIFD
jgi:hypothetical protein